MSKLERHMFTSDYHCPDQNEGALKPLFKFIADFKPDHFHINGDFVNFSSVSRYDHDPHYMRGLKSEIDDCRDLLSRILKVVRAANPKVKIYWEEGNHEERLIKYLVRNADQLALLNVDDEEIVSIPHLFQLRKLGVIWIPATKTHFVKDDLIIEHGNMVRKRAGMTAIGMLESRNMSGTSGHTHRLGVTYRTTFKRVDYWVESGCLCNLKPTPPYVKNPDWQNGFVVGLYDSETKIMHPIAIPIIKNSFIFGDKLYK